MIKPSDLKTIIARDNSAVIADLEEHIDSAITNHVARGLDGPILVGTTRTGWREADIATVLDRYRAAGWTVHAGGRGDVMCTLSPAEPERQYAPVGGS